MLFPVIAALEKIWYTGYDKAFLRGGRLEEDMDCKEVQRKLAAYISGELSGTEESEFVRHVRSCRDCYEELEVYSTVFAGIRQLDGQDDEVDYRTLVEDTLEYSEENMRDERFLKTYFAVLQLGVLLVLLFIIGRWFF